MEDLSNKTISQIVKDYYQTAVIFENFGLDFCCRGNRKLTDVCNEKAIPLEQLLEDLNKVLKSNEKSIDFNAISLSELIEYIVSVHHTYAKENMPRVIYYVNKVAAKHGDKYTYMKEINLLFSELSLELEQHMIKEEKILFPRIRLLEMNGSENKDANYLPTPIDIMEEDHEYIGRLMAEIRELTNNYTLPDNACTTVKLTFDSLKDFEGNLHKHVHLENNILFPKAQLLYTTSSHPSQKIE